LIFYIEMFFILLVDALYGFIAIFQSFLDLNHLTFFLFEIFSEKFLVEITALNVIFTSYC